VPAPRSKHYLRSALPPSAPQRYLLQGLVRALSSLLVRRDRRPGRQGIRCQRQRRLLVHTCHGAARRQDPVARCQQRRLPSLGQHDRRRLQCHRLGKAQLSNALALLTEGLTLPVGAKVRAAGRLTASGLPAASSTKQPNPPCRNGEDWVHEPKLDGYRLQVVKSAGQVRIYSRRGNDWTKRLPLLAKALTAISAHAMILDAELCLLRPDGSPDFYRLQAAIGGRRHELAVFWFGLPPPGGEALRALPSSS